VTGIHSPWARRRKVDLAELASAPWILTAPQTWVYVSVARAFAVRKLPMPAISLAVPSALLRVHLLATGPFVTAVPRSVLRMDAGRRSLKQLGADLNIAGYPLAILTLKNRSLSPLVAVFIYHVRQAADGRSEMQEPTLERRRDRLVLGVP
jgi:DNA-binding transcriptional LysR family regulator